MKKYWNKIQLLRLTLLMVISFLSIFPSAASEFQFKNYDTSAGLSQNSVLAIAQDDMGFMWFGTRDGLNRFDGKTFKIYRKSTDGHGLGSNRISCIYKSPNHELWIGTERGVFIYSPNSDSFRHFDMKADDGIGITDVTTVITGDGQRIFLGNSTQGVFIYDIEKKSLKRHTIGAGLSISGIYVDSNKTLWLALYNSGLCYTRNDFKTIVDFTDESGKKMLDGETVTGMEFSEAGRIYLCSSASGLMELSINTKKLTPLISSAEGKDLYAHHLIKSDNELMMATENGLFTYDISTRTSKHYRYESTNPFTLTDNSLQTVYRDMDGGIWVGSFFGGVCYAPRMSYAFRNYIPRIDVSGSLSGRRVSKLAEGKDGRIWVGTEDGGLSYFMPQTGRFHFVEASADFSNIQSLCVNGQQVWVGTFANGLKVLDANTGKLLHSYGASLAPGHLHDDIIFSLLCTRNGHVYVGTLGGLYLYHADNDTFEAFKELPQHEVYDIMEDHHGNLWVAIYDHGIYMRPAGTTQWQCFSSANSTLVSDNVVSLFENKHGQIWASSDGSGISRYNPSNHRFEVVPIPNNQPKRVVLGITEDNEGLMWLTTNEGLMCYNPENSATRLFTTANGLMNNNFSYNSALCSKGHIYLGCQSGLVAFWPESFLGVTSTPVVIATELVIQGRMVDHFSEDSPLAQSITTTKELTLNHYQNSFAIKMAILSYRDAQMRQISYMLEGFDHDWQSLYSDNYVRYTNLPTGHYVLHVQDMTESGKIAEPYTLVITVLSPWYQRWWAWLCYLLIISGIIYFLYRYWTERTRMSRRLAMEKFEHEKEQELYQNKINFFTNVAHEIRTPLTLIKGPLTDILRKDIENDDDRENLNIMEQNVTRLLNLTNQLLDFRKTERNGLRLNFESCNVAQLVKDVYVRFRPLMQQRDIENTMKLPSEPLQAHVDREAVTKIVSNLLTNATKYCDHFVELTLERIADTIVLTVRNDGTIIDREIRKRIFTPFYRSESAQSQLGTGIGLALARSLAELHSGTLDIVDDPNLNVFQLILPIEQKQTLLHGLDADAVEEKDQETAAGDVVSQEQDTVLIVEDNPQMQSYEKNHLSRQYHVLTADNGEDALKVLAEHEVDIIVSDVMMEGMDGFALCRSVKENVDFSHIPVILLTALTLDSAKVKGMESGADSYIEKPFSMDYLLSVIQNLLRSRHIAKQAYATSPFLQQETVSISKADEELMHRLEKVMAEHLTDSDFDISQMAAEMCMSRTNLNRKIRGMFDLTPNNYIKVERLKRAAQLLKQGDCKVNEVCYMVGFSSPSYFTQCFQKQFGLLPKDFILQNQ